MVGKKIDGLGPFRLNSTLVKVAVVCGHVGMSYSRAVRMQAKKGSHGLYRLLDIIK
jgi:hypothetical protein